MKDEKKSKLFLPFERNGLSLNNRIVMAPMTRSRAFNNLPNDLVAQYYCQRASAGLIISESIVPSPNGLGYPRIAGIFNKVQTEAWKLVTDAIHKSGGKIYAQLNHAGRVGSAVNFPGTGRIMGPGTTPAEMNVWSDKMGLVKANTPERMTIEDIKATINEYTAAAKNAINAGFDGIEIHSANGYLLEQFLNPNVNDRTDLYGGNIENRCRLIIEITEAIADTVGVDRLGIRFSPYNTQASMAHYESIKETYACLASNMQRIGLLYIHLIDTVARLEQTGDAIRIAIDECFDTIRHEYSGIIILNGGYTRERAIAAIASGSADLVSFGMPFISNPDLPYRLEKGLKLAEADRASFYSGKEKGFTDYAVYSQGSNQFLTMSEPQINA
jgi:N-ethylmaleimide reductase